jgi:hypothetical protein
MLPIKRKWACDEPLSQDSPATRMSSSKWGNDGDIVFGGPVFNTVGQTYNKCYPYYSDPQISSFARVFRTDVPGDSHLQVVASSIEQLNHLQGAVGRVAFYNSSSGLQDHKNLEFLSGFFFTPTLFVTRNFEGGLRAYYPMITLASAA